MTSSPTLHTPRRTLAQAQRDLQLTRNQYDAVREWGLSIALRLAETNGRLDDTTALVEEARQMKREYGV